MDWKSSEYLDEKAFERYLIKCGVTQEQLESDLKDHLTLNSPPYGRESQIFEKDGNRFQVYAAEGVNIPYEGVSIICWLDNMPMETLMWFWEKQEERNKIKSLMRYPGANHEWLMLAAIPMLKAMEIPMEKIMEYRTPTDECYFFIDGVQCRHGGHGSTAMHNDLFREIGNAYLECAKKQRHHPFLVLKKYLRRFAEKYYHDKAEDMPDALKKLIGI